MKVVNVKKEKSDVYCGRNSSYKPEYGKDFSKLGNPFSISSSNSRTDVIKEFSNLVWKRWDFYQPIIKELITLEKDKGSELKIGCFCKPDDCHCDIIVKAAEYIEKKSNKKNESLVRISIIGSTEFKNINIFKFHINEILDLYKDKEVVFISTEGEGTNKLTQYFAQHKKADFILISKDETLNEEEKNLKVFDEIIRISDYSLVFCKENDNITEKFIDKSKKSNNLTRVIKIFDEPKIKASIEKEWYSKKMLQNNTKKIYVFGDNLEVRGEGGQAIIRHEPNSFGIATKRKPAMDNVSFFTDKKEEIDIVIEQLKELYTKVLKSKKDDSLEELEIIFPYDGLGTGLAEMEKRSPIAYKKMNETISKFFLGWQILE